MAGGECTVQYLPADPGPRMWGRRGIRARKNPGLSPGQGGGKRYLFLPNARLLIVPSGVSKSLSVAILCARRTRVAVGVELGSPAPSGRRRRRSLLSWRYFNSRILSSFTGPARFTQPVYATGNRTRVEVRQKGGAEGLTPFLSAT